MEDISKKLSIILTTLGQLEEHFSTLSQLSPLRALAINALKTLTTITDGWKKQCDDFVARNETNLGVIRAYVGSVFNCQEISAVQIFKGCVNDLHKVSEYYYLC